MDDTVCQPQSVVDGNNFMANKGIGHKLFEAEEKITQNNRGALVHDFYSHVAQ